MEDLSHLLDDETLSYLGELRERAAERAWQNTRAQSRTRRDPHVRSKSTLKMSEVPKSTEVIGRLPKTELEPLPEGTLEDFPTEHYRIVYSDPPWSGDFGEDYPTLSIEQLSQLPVQRLNHPDGTIHFMWTVGALLDEAIDLLTKHWHYKYRDFAFIWVKTCGKDKATGSDKLHMGQGATTRNSVELCLMAYSGKKAPRDMDDVMQTIIAPVGKHSAKPAEARKRIMELYPWEPRVELFGRNNWDGWTVWGKDKEDGVEQPENAQPRGLINVVPPTPGNSWWDKRKMITVSQASDILGVSPNRVAELCREKRLRAKKFNEDPNNPRAGTWAISKRSVMDFKRQPVGRPRKKEAGGSVDA